jgi:predicted 3-demethylubiquinone-9 3-methyltransferase (glyoxalase superfamily)
MAETLSPSPQKITPFLWFTDNAEDAISFYVSLFPDARVLSLTRTGGSGPEARGPVITGSFQLAGQTFFALNGRREGEFSEAMSLFVRCETQAEIDDLWTKLTADGGQPGRCGWLKDRFGVSWQVVPSVLSRLLGSPDRNKAQRVMQALMGMSKLDIAGLEHA